MINELKLAIAKSRIARLKSSSSHEFALPVRSALLVLESHNLSKLPILLKMKQELGIKDTNFKVVLFKNKQENFSEFDGLTFVKEDLNVIGSFSNKELLDLSKNRIDLLITFAEENNVPINLLATICSACLKVGNSPGNEKVLDVVIRSGDDAGVFASEVIKILKQFKRNWNE
ncbi:hypothetical protein JM83_0272 [Gillisia sp. Hel_I_86]|uniref:DUF6913 domain-containing protein n=1 Tax=Gillisia sp. Hel_I_86 TaxID=1249981 RepID=UPI00119C161C|nr:hypothetical protein [Gillisia sp. Hel_I_86]TVZ25366.1 hypothetical protein JM83_0272 [Gillisia sp. Hel_I_86]